MMMTAVSSLNDYFAAKKQEVADAAQKRFELNKIQKMVAVE